MITSPFVTFEWANSISRVLPLHMGPTVTVDMLRSNISEVNCLLLDSADPPPAHNSPSLMPPCLRDAPCHDLAKGLRVSL